MMYRGATCNKIYYKILRLEWSRASLAPLWIGHGIRPLFSQLWRADYVQFTRFSSSLDIHKTAELHNNIQCLPEILSISLGIFCSGLARHSYGKQYRVHTVNSESHCCVSGKLSETQVLISSGMISPKCGGSFLLETPTQLGLSAGRPLGLPSFCGSYCRKESPPIVCIPYYQASIRN